MDIALMIKTSIMRNGLDDHNCEMQGASGVGGLAVIPSRLVNLVASRVAEVEDSQVRPGAMLSQCTPLCEVASRQSIYTMEKALQVWRE